MERKQPLFNGVRVVSFTHVVTGPMVGKLFADHGAQVICIENRATSTREPGTGAASLTSLNQSNNFNKFNTNILSLTLDMNKSKAREIVRRLVAVSDIVVDNFTPGVLERWGLDYEELVKIKPDNPQDWNKLMSAADYEAQLPKE